MNRLFDFDFADLFFHLCEQVESFALFCYFRMPADCQFILDQHVGSVHCVRFTHDGAYCMTAGDDKTLRLWNPHKEDLRPQNQNVAAPASSSAPRALCVQTYAGVHGYKVLDVAISKDKSKFASGGDDRSVYLWDVGSSRVLRRFQAHLQRTNAVMLNDDDTVLFTASNDKTVKCWDLRAQNSNRDPIETLEGSTDSVTAIARTSNAIVTASVDGAVRVYDLRKGCMQTDFISSDPITSLTISADERLYLVSCLETPSRRAEGLPSNSPSIAKGVVRLLDLASGKLFREYRGHLHQNVKIEAQFSADGRYIVGGSEDGRVLYWDLLQTTVVDETITSGPIASEPGRRHHQPGKDAISSLACHPDEDKGLFLTAAYSGQVKVWKHNNAP